MKKTDNGFVHQIRSFLERDLWRLEPSSLSGARRRGLKFLRVCALVIKGFREDKCPLHASALTFSFVMALIPTLVIALSFAKAFGMESLSHTVIESLQPPAIEQPAGAPAAETVDDTDAIAEDSNPVGSYITNVLQQMPDQGKEIIVQILKTVENASAGAMGGFGLVLFLYIMIRMLSQIEETFNLVWGVKTSRSMMDKVRNYVFIMAATPVFIILGITAGPTIIAISAKLDWIDPSNKLFTLVIPALFMSLGFSIFYIFLPNTKVRVGPAFTGALISSALIIILQLAMIKLGFGVSKYNRIYGALAAIPIFLFWVQISWIILLMGSEVAFSVQNAGTYAREQFAVNPSPRARLYLAFALMKRITEKFESPDDPFNAVAYGIDKRIPVRLINDVVKILSDAGLVAESTSHPNSYTLLRDPRSITARNIADAIFDAGASPENLGLAGDLPMLGKITGESFQTLEKQVLENF